MRIQRQMPPKTLTQRPGFDNFTEGYIFLGNDVFFPPRFGHFFLDACFFFCFIICFSAFPCFFAFLLNICFSAFPCFSAFCFSASLLLSAFFFVGGFSSLNKITPKMHHTHTHIYIYRYTLNQPHINKPKPTSKRLKQL